MTALGDFARFAFEHGKTLTAHKEAGMLWKKAEAELTALLARAEKAEARVAALEEDSNRLAEIIDMLWGQVDDDGEPVRVFTGKNLDERARNALANHKSLCVEAKP